jgi:hypothetical protein
VKKLGEIQSADELETWVKEAGAWLAQQDPADPMYGGWKRRYRWAVGLLEAYRQGGAPAKEWKEANVVQGELWSSAGQGHR